MSERNVIHENFHTKHSVFTVPDKHVPYIIQLHIVSIQPEREKLYDVMHDVVSVNDGVCWSDKGAQSLRTHCRRKITVKFVPPLPTPHPV